MEEDLTDAIKAAPSLRNRIGARVSWQERPQGEALPAICLHLIDHARGYTMESEDAESPARVQANCLGETRGAAVDLAKALIAWASARRGVGSIRVIYVDDERDLTPDTQDSGTIFGRAVDLILWAEKA